MGRMELLRAQMTQSLLAAGGGKACGCATTVPRQLLPKQGLNDPFMQKTQQGAAPLLLQALGPLRLPPLQLRTQTKQSYTYNLFYCILFA